MIKTSHPMNCDFIKLSCTAISDRDIQKVQDMYEQYNYSIANLKTKLPESILHTFFNEGPEQLMSHDINVDELEINNDDKTLQFHIKGYFHAQDNNAVGSLLFTGVKDLVAEFDDSPITEDYLVELLQDRDVLEIYFDSLPNGEFIVDIYSLNEEPFEDDNDNDDFQILHIQFKFSGYSADLEAITPEPEDNENIDAMDTFD